VITYQQSGASNVLKYSIFFITELWLHDLYTFNYKGEAAIGGLQLTGGQTEYINVILVH
jgi:hypothetical protein